MCVHFHIRTHDYLGEPVYMSKITPVSRQMCAELASSQSPPAHQAKQCGKPSQI